MATVVTLLASFENGLVQWEMEHDNVVNRISAFRCVNLTTKPAYGGLRRDSDKQEAGITAPPLATTGVTISKMAVGSRVDYIKGERGFFSGCRQVYRYPA